jgi:hypothetical protein
MSGPTPGLSWEECAAALGWEYIPALGQWRDTRWIGFADDAEMACDLSGYETIESARAAIAKAKGGAA